MADEERYYRKVIRIRAEDSPNVRYALLQERRGEKPTDDVLVKGVITWGEFKKRRATWDIIRQTIGLDAEFYEGAEVLMFPPDWMTNAERVAETRPKRLPPGLSERYMGVDPAEGGDRSSWVIGDLYGVLKLVSAQTPDTTVVPATTIHLMEQWGVAPENVVFDRGGGGKEHADRLRQLGFNVRTVAFGESVSLEPKRGTQSLSERKEIREESYAYKNRRTEMYATTMHLLDPHAPSPLTGRTFGIPSSISRWAEGGRKSLRDQLTPIPKRYDQEQRLYVLPKNKRHENDDKSETLTKLIGHSPDEADALVLMVFAMTHKPTYAVAGVS